VKARKEQEREQMVAGAAGLTVLATGLFDKGGESA